MARSSGAPQELLVRETAAALASFANDPSGLVTACRRIVSRQLTAGSLWWLCSRMLCAADPFAEARLAVDEIEDDPTPRRLATELADGATAVVVVGDRGPVAVEVVDGRARPAEVPAEPTVRLELPVTTFAALVGGRDDAPDDVVITGDADLGERIVAGLGFLP